MRPGIWQALDPTEEQQWLPEGETKEQSPWGNGSPLGVCVKNTKKIKGEMAHSL